MPEIIVTSAMSGASSVANTRALMKQMSVKTPDPDIITLLSVSIGQSVSVNIVQPAT